MPRQRGQRQNFTFNKGWNTEASPLTFPENTASDLDNVVLDIDGSVRRRMGIACESATSTRYFQRVKSLYTKPAISFYKWENVAGSGNFNLLVSQFGTTLQFNEDDGTDAGTIDFSDLIITGRGDEALKATVEVASGLGYLFVTAPFTEPFYVTYNVSTGVLSKTSFAIEIRDFEGVDDGLAVDARPSTLSTSHLYNLRNQGWPASFPCDSGSDPVQRTFDVLGGYPSNADVLYFGKTSTGTDEADIGLFSPSTMSKNLFGTSPAAKGKYVINAFDQNRSGVSGISGTLRTTINNRPRAVAFHNGRAFYAGINAVGYSGKVYYSQQLDTISKVGRCYQDNDPTAEEFNELLATDGGVITIPGCGNILRIQEGSAGIVVFASNGMWEITGENGKFSADNYFVRKVTDIGCISGDSVVNADGTFFYWSDAGIVGTQSDQVTGAISADVITKTSIQIGYLLFGGPQRRGSRGIWIRGEKKVVWLYSTDANYDGVDDRFKYNGVLILDTNIGAFYKYSISDFNVGEAPYVSGIVESSSATTISAAEVVTAGGADVTAGGVDVTSGVTAVDSDTVTSSWKLQVVRPNAVGTNTAYGIDFATFSSRTFTDWYFEDSAGADYTSFLETGYDYGGQAMFDKKPTYVYTYMSRVSKSNINGGFYNIPDPTETTAFIGDLTGAVLCSESTPGGSGIAVKPGESLIYTHDGGVITERSMSTAGDLTTLSATGVTYDTGDTNRSSMHSVDGIWWAIQDIRASQSFRVYVYKASTAWDITTLTFHGQFNAASGRNNWTTTNGLTFYVHDATSGEIRTYVVDYDLQTSTLSSTLTTVGGISACFSPNFNNYYVYDSTVNEVETYNGGVLESTIDTSATTTTAAWSAIEPVVGTALYMQDSSKTYKFCVV